MPLFKNLFKVAFNIGSILVYKNRNNRLRDISPLCSLELCSCSYDTKTRFRPSSTPAARLFIRWILFLEIQRLVTSRFNVYPREKMHHGSTADTGIIVLPESIIRPLNNDSLEDGNKAPCYPANTVIARSAHNGTLATHSFRTHEPTEFQRKGVNLS